MRGECDLERQAEIFKALSDVNRLKIIDMLSCGELCVCDIIDKLNLTQSTVSHHAKILKQAGLIKSHKKGKWTIYAVNEEAFKAVEEYLKYISSYKCDCICEKVK